MKIAVEGCCHGQLDAIYDQIAILEIQHNYKVDLLLICGDFQAIRNWQDVQCMARSSEKHEGLADFHKYYTGEKVAPIPTIVIGGNHEASNYMWELYHGGWLAKNIYFLGHAGVVQVNGIRIAGASGIFKAYNFRLGHHEKLPYDGSTMRSIYHTREYEIRRLSLLSSPHIFLSHDWPQSIEHHGDFRDLIARKSSLKSDILSRKLGSPPLMGLLQTLRPHWWLSAHLHIRFEATYSHSSAGAAIDSRPHAPVLSPPPTPIEDSNDVAEETKGKHVPQISPKEVKRGCLETAAVEVSSFVPAPHALTHFLALDECLPQRQFLEIIDLEAPLPNELPVFSFDPEWLAISRAFHPWLSTTRFQHPFPDKGKACAMVAAELEWVKINIKEDEDGLIPIGDWQTFVQTAPGPGFEGPNKFQQPPAYVNPQTTSFCNMLGIEDKINL